MSGQTPGNLWAALQDVHVDGPEVDAMNAFVRLGTDSLRVVASRRGRAKTSVLRRSTSWSPTWVPEASAQRQLCQKV